MADDAKILSSPDPEVISRIAQEAARKAAAIRKSKSKKRAPRRPFNPQLRDALRAWVARNGE